MCVIQRMATSILCTQLTILFLVKVQKIMMALCKTIYNVHPPIHTHPLGYLSLRCLAALYMRSLYQCSLVLLLSIWWLKEWLLLFDQNLPVVSIKAGKVEFTFAELLATVESRFSFPSLLQVRLIITRDLDFRARIKISCSGNFLALYAVGKRVLSLRLNCGTVPITVYFFHKEFD